MHAWMMVGNCFWPNFSLHPPRGGWWGGEEQRLHVEKLLIGFSLFFGGFASFQGWLRCCFTCWLLSSLCCSYANAR